MVARDFGGRPPRTCNVNSGTVNALYCWLPLAVSGANPGMKKCSLGNGTMFTANLRRSALSCPGKRKHVVTPDMVTCANIIVTHATRAASY